MPKEITKSFKVGSNALFEAFKILQEAGGEMRGFDVIAKLRNTVKFDEWESYLYPKTGYIRWESILQFVSIDAVKAGYLIKNKGLWILTPEGEAAIRFGAVGLLQNAKKEYRKWKNTKDASPILEFPESESDTEFELELEKGIPVTQKSVLEMFESTAANGIRDFVLKKNPYEFQDLVAAILNVMGYHISHVSPKGKDGGIDIIAYTDPLGTKQPRIIVQVKHRTTSSVPADDIRGLIGTLKRESDVGIFVTSGDFSQPAKNEARLSGKHIELIDFDRFIELWMTNYDKMKDEYKNMLPLQPIYFLGSNE